MDDTFTHDDLLLPASKLLKRNGKRWKVHSTFIELMSGREIPDVFGFASGRTSLAEVKVNRQDFLRDLNKPFRRYPEKGMGNYRFYVCPEGLITPDEVPEKWGLGYYNGRSIDVIVRPESQASNKRAELNFAASVMRRINADNQLR